MAKKDEILGWITEIKNKEPKRKEKKAKKKNVVEDKQWMIAST